MSSNHDEKYQEFRKELNNFKRIHTQHSDLALKWSPNQRDTALRDIKKLFNDIQANKEEADDEEDMEFEEFIIKRGGWKNYKKDMKKYFEKDEITRYNDKYSGDTSKQRSRSRSRDRTSTTQRNDNSNHNNRNKPDDDAKFLLSTLGWGIFLLILFHFYSYLSVSLHIFFAFLSPCTFYYE